MTTPGTDFADRVEAAVRARRADAITELGRDGTLWLAAAPLWTRHAAQAARFPVPSVIEFVRRARNIGWCETRGSLRGEGAPGLRFWMPDEVRRGVLDLLGQGGNRQRLAEEARLIADRIDQRAPRRGAEAVPGAEVPEALRYWALLVSRPVPDLALVAQVAQAVDAQDLTVAQQLVSAGEALAPLLAGTMELATDRARRLLSLGTRRRQDARALVRYLDRPELSSAVEDLLRPSAARWALHLRGVGGVGKTMLVRYLASGRYTAERNELPLTIARVDFDHMSPDYPVRRPVQLLLELADELALHTAADGLADEALTRFTAMATSVHESLSSAREEHAAPMRNPAVLDAIDTFADTLRLLPRPLLILDTCEELAKADAGDPAAPAVSNTLAIIERINDRAPDVRVLLGRRKLPARNYLTVEPVRGFTADEAARYLTAFASRRLPDELVRAMIRQSPAVDPEPGPGQRRDRVSPFDLALYREWADEDPDLDVARVERGSHAYVEGRIIERLDDPGVRQALPVLATAGRCRVSTICAFLGADPVILGLRLAEQEWIESDGDPPTHVSARPALALRLRRYFAEPERSAAFAAETARLAAMLTEQVRDAPLDDVDGDELLAALRLSEPADAVRLWDELAGRAAAEGRWTWLFNTTRRVSGESAAEQWPTADALRATVLAATIAARRRVIPGFNPAADWAEVGRLAGLHPDAEAARCLRARAALGALGYAPDGEELLLTLEPGFGHYDSDARVAEVVAAAVDAAHRLLEAGAEGAARPLLDQVGREWPQASLTAAVSAVSADYAESSPVPIVLGAAWPWNSYPVLQAWLLVAYARLLADDDPPAARQALAAAAAYASAPAWAAGSQFSWHLRALDVEDAPAAPRSWYDLILPDDLYARVRIEQGLIDWLNDDGSGNDTWKDYAGDRLRAADANLLISIDGERLISLCLLRLLSYEVPEPALIGRWADADNYTPGRAATSSAHDLIPPLFVSIAEAWLAAGDPQRALDHVERHRSNALDSRDDEATLRQADAVTMRIARRLRLDDQLALLSRLASPTESSPARLGLADDARRAIAVVRGEPPQYADADVTGRPAGWHAWWQCQTRPIGQVPPVLWDPDRTDTTLAADIEVDLDEFGRLSAARQQQLTAAPALVGWLSRPRPAPRARSAQPYRNIRAELRSRALEEARLITGALRVASTISAPPGVPPRLLAEMAFDEAELLALRFPYAAAVLYKWAAASYQVARDDTGWMLAELALVTTVLAAQQATEDPDAVAVARFHRVAAEISPATEIPFRPDGKSSTAGPWRYWARLWAEVPPPAAAPGSAGPVPRPRAGRRLGLDGLLFAVAFGPAGYFFRRLQNRFAGAGESAARLALLADPRTLPARRAGLAAIGQIALVGAVFGLAEFAIITLWVVVAGLPGFTPLIAAGGAAVAVVTAAMAARRWRRGDLLRLADGVAVGTVFRPSSLAFTALVRPGRQSGDYSVALWANPRPLWQVPRRQWPRLFATVLAMSLASPLRSKSARRNGYRGSFTAAESNIRWHGDGPEADARWWSGPGAAGRIVTLPTEATQPWERIITRSLGPPAAGRVEWRRQVYVNISPSSGYSANLIAGDPYQAHQGTDVLLDASPDWAPVFADAYPAPAGQLVQVRHAIGAVVSTAAGTRLQVGARSPDNSGLLLGTEELRVGDPSLIIIQAEPTADYASPTAPDSGDVAPTAAAAAPAAIEFAERQAASELQAQLALAVDLIRSAAAPAVLLVPALPAGHVAAMADAIARYASSTGDAASDLRPNPRQLQAELRELVRPAVRPTTLDDIVLFRNARE